MHSLKTKSFNAHQSNKTDATQDSCPGRLVQRCFNAHQSNKTDATWRIGCTRNYYLEFQCSPVQQDRCYTNIQRHKLHDEDVSMLTSLEPVMNFMVK